MSRNGDRWIELPPGSWVGCEAADRRRRERDAKRAKAAESDGVIEVPARCPRCGSRRVPAYSKRLTQDPPIRYRRCRSCGHGFKSVERRDA